MILLKQHARPSLLIAVTLCCVMLTGCQDSNIKVHEGVPVTRKSKKKNTEPAYRMIAAIAEHSSGTWFFKLSGPITNVQALQGPWQTFLQSIGFGTDEPLWDLPEGWGSNGLEDRPMPGGSSMRIANIDTGDKDVALSVTSMPAGQQLLPNVNRWRGQLGLAPISQIEMARELSNVENESLSFKVFAADGPELTTRMGGRPPFAGPRTGPPKSVSSGHPPIKEDDSIEESSTTDTKEPSLEFTQPDGWTAGNTSSMVLARLSRELSGQAAEMLLLRMKPTEASWNNNISAWSKEVDANETADPTPTSESIKVAGIDARKIRLTGSSKDNPENRAVLAVMFTNPSGNGFVLKLSGPESAVTEAEPDFQNLLDSIRFSEPKE